MTGRELLAWMRSVEERLETWEGFRDCADVGRCYNSYRKRRRRDRVYWRLEEMYGDMVQLGKQGHLSLVAYLNLYAAHHNRTIMPELYADVPDEALEPLRPTSRSHLK